MALKDDYVTLIKELLPPGPAWPRDDTTSAYAIAIDEIAAVCADIDKQSRLLIEESDPLTAAQSFEDWETDWGLPDECVTAFSETEQTMAQRRALLLLKTRFVHGQSAAFFESLAAFFGHIAKVEELRDEHDPSLDFVWQMVFTDDAIEDWGLLQSPGAEEETEDWGLLSDVTVPIVADWDMGLIRLISNAAYDQATAMMQVTDPLATWGDALIECVIRRYAPAHTTVRFAYM
jgi:uncharacterized protein YmfQ (DUF2313 family)